MDGSMLQKIKEILGQNDQIDIAVGKNPGVDEMGGALALYLSLQNSGKRAAIACETAPIVEVSSLVGIDEVKTSFDTGGSGDLTVAFPYKEGEIEKISYTLADGFLNIQVKAGEAGLSFDEKDIKYKRAGNGQEVVFTIGAPLLSDLGKLFDITSLRDTKIINIDNKAENQGYGDIVLVSKNFSSVSEQVASVILSLGLKMDVDTAQNLLSGISSATDNFQNPNTSPLAFEMAGVLMKKGGVRIKSRLIKPVAENGDPYSFFSPLPPKKPKQEYNKIDDNNPPSDWLAPKIYKGSTSI